VKVAGQALETLPLNFVTGKGGVGKTTLAAALALASAERGLRTLLVSLESRPDLPLLLGLPREHVGYEPVQVGPRLELRILTAPSALQDYLEEHGLKRLTKRLAATGLLDLVSTAVPGLREILVLGKVKQLVRRASYDSVIVDAGASGQAVELLKSPFGLLDAARSGPVRDQAEDVVDLLRDPTLCQIVFCTTAEETPVRETIETAFWLEEKLGIRPGFVLANMVLDPQRELEELVGAANSSLPPPAGECLEYLRELSRIQISRISELASALPLPIYLVRDVLSPELGLSDLEALAAEIGTFPWAPPDLASPQGDPR
jgi:anion-transporting  ArsA/GET3 family ATPase